MSWFNYYGLIAVVIVLIPNIIYAILACNAFQNAYRNRAMLAVEQIGRYGCIAFMVFNVPYTWFGFWFPHAFTVYLCVGGALLALYLFGWVVFWKRAGSAKALWLSVTPTLLFLFCGAVLRSVPLLVFAVLFGIGHITVSIKNIK